MVCTWTNTSKYLKTVKDFDTPESVIKFCAKVKPTTKILAKIFFSDPKTEGNRASYRFFMQYIWSLEDFESMILLRLLTGSDIIIIENIEISFSAMEGLARRPIAHTCEIFANICADVKFAKLTSKLLWISRRVYKYIECWENWNRFHLKIIEIGLKLKKKEIIYFCHLHVLTLLSFKHVTFLSFKHILPFLFLL